MAAALAPNYYAFCEAILAPGEAFIDGILYRYGLLEGTEKDLKDLEILEMKRLYYEENWTYRKIAKEFGISDSGVYRRMKKERQDNGGDILSKSSMSV